MGRGNALGFHESLALPTRAPVSRYRLRFLLQEVDLPPGETVVGRSSSCHLTLQDPLVSRRHAALRVDGETLAIRDLGSRNGILVNGRPIQSSSRLGDKDRIRIGTHELVVSAVSLRGVARRKHTPPTGFKWRCGSCRQLYPSGLDQCPECGTLAPREEETLTGALPAADGNWSLLLLAEVVDRAVSLGRWEDVQRVLERARATLGAELRSEPAERRSLGAVASAAIHLAERVGDAQWILWSMGLFTGRGALPDWQTLQALERLPAPLLAAALPALRGFAVAAGARGGPALSPNPRDIIKLLAAQAQAVQGRVP